MKGNCVDFPSRHSQSLTTLPPPYTTIALVQATIISVLSNFNSLLTISLPLSGLLSTERPILSKGSHCTQNESPGPNHSLKHGPTLASRALFSPHSPALHCTPATQACLVLKHIKNASTSGPLDFAFAVPSAGNTLPSLPYLSNLCLN